MTLQALIRARMDERGWSYADLAHRSGDALTKGRWQQLGGGTPMKAFPDPHNIAIMARVLEVDDTAVVLAAAQSLGLDVSRRGPDLAQLLPAGTEALSERMRDALLAMVRAAVADTHDRVSGDRANADGDRPGGSVLEWAKTQPRSGNEGFKAREKHA